VAGRSTPAATRGAPFPVPTALPPTGYPRMLHAGGEFGAARSGARRGLPYTLSTMATTGIEDLAAAVGQAVPGERDLWFQLYILKDRAQAYELVDRAAGNGYRVLVVTVDTVVAG